MGLVNRLGSYARRASPKPPRHFPDARRELQSTQCSTVGTCDRTFWRGTFLPCVAGTCRFTPLSPIPSECTLGELLARCGMSWRAEVSLPIHTHTLAHAPAAVLPEALTAGPRGACGHTPCFRRARPPYAPAHSWRAHLQSAAYLSQTADWGSAVVDGVTMVMVIPAGVAGIDGFFLK